jgi:O-antigen ligase
MSNGAVAAPPAADSGSSTAEVSARATRRVAWPLWVITVGTAPAMAVGLHGLSWMLPGLVFGARILSHRPTRFPLSSLPLVVLVCWIPLSATVIPPSGLPLFTYRWLLWVGCLATFVWLVNVDERVVPSHRIVDWLAALWITLVVFGYFATLLPDLASPSPLGYLLGPIGRIEFVARLSEWRFAETQQFLGYPVPRPAAPFGSSNAWGSAMGILTPYFLKSWVIGVSAARRRKGVLIGLVAIYPILVSVNRGLWLSLIVGGVYFAARRALRGRFTALALLMAGVIAVAALLVVTPAGGLVTDRLDKSERSNSARSSLYERAWQGALDSPLVGHGAPVFAPDLPEGTPPVGTHGLIWYLMFIHGFFALALFLVWLAIEVFRSGRLRTPLAWWVHLSLIATVVQMPYYGLMPHLVIVGATVGLAHRETRRPVPGPSPRGAW